jgi:hypothetical protein
MQLPCMVDFQYLDGAIRATGQWYPVLKMDWVEGFTLNEFVRRTLDDRQELRKLSQAWISLARYFQEGKLAHGDLQHANVLLVPGQTLSIKLVDYDGMFVPALAHQPSGEVGHPAYQHPQRSREGVFSADIDRFPLLVIYCAIRALISGGRGLWERYDNGDNLLFREQDLLSPRDSALFWEIARLDDPELRRLADCLSRAVYKSLDQTPLLEELICNRPATISKPETEYVRVGATVETRQQDWASAPPPVRVRTSSRLVSRGVLVRPTPEVSLDSAQGETVQTIVLPVQADEVRGVEQADDRLEMSQLDRRGLLAGWLIIFVAGLVLGLLLGVLIVILKIS